MLAIVAFIALACVQSRSTWVTPPQWAASGEAVAMIHRYVPAGKPLVASEALIFLTDRQGYRLEIGQKAQERAASEWGQQPIQAEDPIALVEFYQDQGAEYFADLTEPTDPRRTALQHSIRRRFTILFDDSGVLIARLDRSREPSHASR